MPHLIAVVAMDPNRLIGRNGGLPWHIPADLAFFKKTTLGSPILMGRKTFESIGRPLPKRRNIVLTRDTSWQHPGVDVIHTPAEIETIEGPVYVIGGGQIYRSLSEKIDEWLVSHVKSIHEGDTYLAEFEQDFPTVHTVEEHGDFTVKKYLRG
ncbi:dihydrofolate reductase [Luteolibacter algae]|uniref:dihydrofolate reductase n=1 Tax=Luteolibacter algae TaxID=454151 RepID=A0ABW5D5D4_9BACT